jgi:hypothetical protein
MLSKIYYIGSGVIILIYSLVNMIIVLTPKPPEPKPQARSIGVVRVEKGKYVYVPPRTNRGSYPGSGGSSYPSGGGYSGGK